MAVASARQLAYPLVTDTAVTLNGNPEVGTVHHLARTHGARFGEDLDELRDLGARNVGVLVRLRELAVQHCFLEGWEAGADVRSLVADKRTTADFETAFPGRELPTSALSDQQALLLARDFSSALQHFFPRVKLHGTEPPAHEVTAADLPHTTPELRQKLVFEHRERRAFDSLRKVISGLELGDRTVALLYGADHTWDRRVLANAREEDTAPKVIKEYFEPWSAFEWTSQLKNAATADEQLKLLKPGRRYDSWVWPALHSPEVQLKVIPQIKTFLDWYPTPGTLAEYLTSYMRHGDAEQAQQLRAAIQRCQDARSGPFADLCIRPGAEDALRQARGPFSSVAIYDETHPFTQLLLVCAAPFIKDYAFSRLLSVTAQLAALPKLQSNERDSPETTLRSLLAASRNDGVRTEIVRRARSGEPPFTSPARIDGVQEAAD